MLLLYKGLLYDDKDMVRFIYYLILFLLGIESVELTDLKFWAIISEVIQLVGFKPTFVAISKKCRSTAVGDFEIPFFNSQFTEKFGHNYRLKQLDICHVNFDQIKIADTVIDLLVMENNAAANRSLKVVEVKKAVMDVKSLIIVESNGVCDLMTRYFLNFISEHFERIRFYSLQDCERYGIRFHNWLCHGSIRSMTMNDILTVPRIQMVGIFPYQFNQNSKHLTKRLKDVDRKGIEADIINQSKSYPYLNRIIEYWVQCLFKNKKCTLGGAPNMEYIMKNFFEYKDKYGAALNVEPRCGEEFYRQNEIIAFYEAKQYEISLDEITYCRYSIPNAIIDKCKLLLNEKFTECNMHSMNFLVPMSHIKYILLRDDYQIIQTPCLTYMFLHYLYENQLVKLYFASQMKLESRKYVVDLLKIRYGESTIEFIDYNRNPNDIIYSGIWSMYNAIDILSEGKSCSRKIDIGGSTTSDNLLKWFFNLIENQTINTSINI